MKKKKTIQGTKMNKLQRWTIAIFYIVSENDYVNLNSRDIKTSLKPATDTFDLCPYFAREKNKLLHCLLTRNLVRKKSTSAKGIADDSVNPSDNTGFQTALPCLAILLLPWKVGVLSSTYPAACQAQLESYHPTSKAEEAIHEDTVVYPAECTLSPESYRKNEKLSPQSAPVLSQTAALPTKQQAPAVGFFLFFFLDTCSQTKVQFIIVDIICFSRVPAFSLTLSNYLLHGRVDTNYTDCKYKYMRQIFSPLGAICSPDLAMLSVYKAK